METSALIAALRLQTACCVHITRQLSPAQADFRFTPGQRSTIELLRYLSTQNPGVTAYIITGSWDYWGALEAANKELSLSDMPAALQRQQALTEALLAPWSDARLRQRQVRMWWGESMPMIAALQATTARFSVGYTMQLFLQAKASGLTGLNSGDLWFPPNRST